MKKGFVINCGNTIYINTQTQNKRKRNNNFVINLGERMSDPNEGHENGSLTSEKEYLIYVGDYTISLENIFVTIKNAPNHRRKNQTPLKLIYKIVGKNILNKYVDLDDEYINVEWFTSDNTIAEVKSNNKLYCYDVGECEITLKVTYTKGDTILTAYAHFNLTVTRCGFTYTFNFNLS